MAIMPNAFTLSVALLIVMLKIIMLSVFVLNVIMLSVVAPLKLCQLSIDNQKM
jgi:hypothetical protein